jgi:hypothetical protein
MSSAESATGTVSVVACTDVRTPVHAGLWTTHPGGGPGQVAVNGGAGDAGLVGDLLDGVRACAVLVFLVVPLPDGSHLSGADGPVSAGSGGPAGNRIALSR